MRRWKKAFEEECAAHLTTKTKLDAAHEEVRQIETAALKAVTSNAVVIAPYPTGTLRCPKCERAMKRGELRCATKTCWGWPYTYPEWSYQITPPKSLLIGKPERLVWSCKCGYDIETLTKEATNG